MRSLSSFVVEIDLSRSTWSDLLRAVPGGRVEFLPLSTNGAGHPHRFLVCGAGRGRGLAGVAASLRERLASADPVTEDEGTFSFTATLPESLLAAVRDVTSGRLADGEVEIVFRPALLVEARLLLSGIVVRGPFGAALRDAIGRLTALGFPARLVRYEPFVPGSVAPAAYEEALTPKQAKILRMAVALGHYDAPRGCTLDDLATLFGISKAAAADRIRLAERKVLSMHFQ